MLKNFIIAKLLFLLNAANIIKTSTFIKQLTFQNLESTADIKLYKKIMAKVIIVIYLPFHWRNPPHYFR